MISTTKTDLPAYAEIIPPDAVKEEVPDCVKTEVIKCEYMDVLDVSQPLTGQVKSHDLPHVTLPHVTLPPVTLPHVTLPPATLSSILPNAPDTTLDGDWSSPPYSDPNHPASTLLQLPSAGSPVPQNLLLPAFYLYCQGSYERALSFIRSTPFPPQDHPRLQSLWYEILYAQFREMRRCETLTPAQKYRTRTRYPIPPSISSTKFKANNMFDPSTKAILDAYFSVSPYLPGKEYEVVKAKTGLSQSQIKNYFKNKRSRTKDPRCDNVVKI